MSSILATTALLALYSVLALPAGILLERRRAEMLAWATLALAATAFVVALPLVWGAFESWEWLITLSAFAGACSQTAALTAFGYDHERALLYLSSAVLAFGTAVLLSAIVLTGDFGLWHVLGAVAVADVVCALVQPIVRRLRAARAAAMRYRVVFALESEPSPQALAVARQAFAEAGGRVERVEPLGRH